MSVISFPVEAEYRVLDHVLEVLSKESIALIHSKSIPQHSNEHITLIDATGHAPTARTALRRRVGEYDNINVFENPADVQGVLTQLGKLAGSVRVGWWLWWSPSDMIAQGLTDEEVARCMRSIAKDFSETRFLGFVAKDVHSQRGLATLKYVSSTFVDISQPTSERQGVHRWRLAKHLDREIEGDEIEV
ncbi:hypothetical protein EU527_04550 [Candidatus Thorarchaeota archaeon]|nr:MAG: hypothetical protein EU527_04550 [Candidatus Thorarchaeota archaeon]